jgi:hypothetical protein
MARNGIQHVGVIVARSVQFPVMLNEKDDMTLDLFSEQVAADSVNLIWPLLIVSFGPTLW